MAKNEFLVRRVAFGNFSMPANVASNTASTLSAPTGAFVPKGAIVTGIRYFNSAAWTNSASFSAGTINVLIGGQAIGTNNLGATAALIATHAVSQAVVTNAGVLVTAGGPVVINFASSDANRTGIAGTADVYVEYLYCADRDIV